MKKMVSVAVVAALGAASGSAMAMKSYDDVARVVSSTPVYESYSVPRQQCWAQPVTRYETQAVQTGYVARPAIGAGTVIGAIVGGVIGHQMGGSDRARDAATVAGTVIGGAIGHSADRGNGVGYVAQPAYATRTVPVTHNVQRCNTVNEVHQRVVAYDVRYTYHGRDFLTRMAHNPGRTLRVNVDVHPNGSAHVHYRAVGPSTPIYTSRGF